MAALLVVFSAVSRGGAEMRVFVSSPHVDELEIFQSFDAVQTSFWVSAHVSRAARVVLVVRAGDKGGSEAGSEAWFSLLDEATAPRIAYPAAQVPSCPMNTRGTPHASTFEERTTVLPRHSERFETSEAVGALLSGAEVSDSTALFRFIAAEPGPYWAAIFDMEADTWTQPLGADIVSDAAFLPSLYAPHSGVQFRLMTLAERALHVASVYEATVPELLPRYLLATASTNYSTLLERFVENDPEAWVIESSGPTSLFLAQLSDDDARTLQARFALFGESAHWLTRHAGFLEGDLAKPMVRPLSFEPSAALSPIVPATEFDTSGCFARQSGGSARRAAPPVAESDPEACSGCVYPEDDGTVYVASEASCGSSYSQRSDDDDSDDDDADSCAGDSSDDSSDESCSGDSTSDSHEDEGCGGPSPDSEDDSPGCGGPSPDSEDDSPGCGGPAPDSEDEEATCSVQGTGDKPRRPKRAKLSVLTMMLAACAFPLRRSLRKRRRRRT